MKRFFREARVLSLLHHPNTVRLLDFGVEGDTPFIVMERLHGVTLQSLLRLQVPLPERFALHVALRIARTLAEAHKLSILHRDIKPGNIMLVPMSEGRIRVKVLDFGLARFFMPYEGQTVTEVDKFVGTVRYLAPECLVSSRQDARRDLYSLGIVLYEMLSTYSPLVDLRTR